MQSWLLSRTQKRVQVFWGTNSVPVSLWILEKGICELALMESLSSNPNFVFFIKNLSKLAMTEHKWSNLNYLSFVGTAIINPTKPRVLFWWRHSLFFCQYSLLQRYVWFVLFFAFLHKFFVNELSKELIEAIFKTLLKTKAGIFMVLVQNWYNSVYW